MAFLPIAAAGISAVSAIAGGLAGGASADYQAQVAQNNAKIAQQNADYAIQAGEEKATEESQKGASKVASITAAQAASGVDVNTGSAVNVQESQREADALSDANVMNNAQNTAYGYRTQAVSDQAQAQLDQQQASQSRLSGFLGATGSLLGNAKSTGIFGGDGVDTGYQGWMSTSYGG